MGERRAVLGFLVPTKTTRPGPEPVLCPQRCLVGPHWTHVSSWVHSHGRGLGDPAERQVDAPHGAEQQVRAPHGARAPSAPLPRHLHGRPECLLGPQFQQRFLLCQHPLSSGESGSLGCFSHEFWEKSPRFCPTPDLCGQRSEAPWDLSWDRLL